MAISKLLTLAGTITGLLAGGWFVWYWNKKHIKTKMLSQKELSSASWQRVGTMSRLWLYPVKSCAPLQLTEATTQREGLQDIHTGIRDRSYLIINDNEKATMVTGRMCPKTVLIASAVESNGDITFTCPGMEESCTVTSEHKQQGRTRHTKVWNDTVVGVDCGDHVAHWLSQLLKRDVRLLYHDQSCTSRVICQANYPVHLPLLKPQDNGGLYADINSYMLMSTVSTKDIERKMGTPLDPLQFRPNILVTGCSEDETIAELQPYQEDSWSYIRIGEEAIFRNVSPCDRCVFTCVDPATGVNDPAMTVLKTLKRNRTAEAWKDPLMGINLGLETAGTIRTGDAVYALQ